MPTVQGISFAVPHSMQEVSLSAQLNNFFESNPSITLLSVAFSRREHASPRPVHALTLLFATGVQVFSSSPGGGPYRAVEFLGSNAEAELNAFFDSSAGAAYQLAYLVELSPVVNRYTTQNHLLAILRERGCYDYREIEYFTVSSTQPVPFYTAGPALYMQRGFNCAPVPVLNLNTQPWLAQRPSLGIRSFDEQYNFATVTVGANLTPSAVIPGIVGTTPAPPGTKAPCPCCFRISSFVIQRGIADCQHLYQFTVDYNTCYSGHPIDIVKALVTGGIMTPGVCWCNPPDYYMPFPNAQHYSILTVTPFDQGYLLVICIEDVTTPCTDLDYNDIFIYVKLDRCYGDCKEAPIKPAVAPVIPP